MSATSRWSSAASPDRGGSIGALALGVRDGALLVALLPFLVCRSVLAASQVRAFVTGAYRVLIVVGLVLVPVLLDVMITAGRSPHVSRPSRWPC